jgi:glutaredoxin
MNISLPPITVYTRPACPACEVMKAKLTREGYTYTTVDIDSHPQMYRQAVESGIRTLPLVVVGGKLCTTFAQVHNAIKGAPL